MPRPARLVEEMKVVLGKYYPHEKAGKQLNFIKEKVAPNAGIPAILAGLEFLKLCRFRKKLPVLFCNERIVVQWKKKR